MQNIYEIFNVKNKEELYLKVINNDESVRELTDFLNYAKKNIKKGLNKITIPEKAAEYLSPLDDEIIEIIKLNAKCKPIGITSVNLKGCLNDKIENKIKEEILSSIYQGAFQIFVHYNAYEINATLNNLNLEPKVKVAVNNIRNLSKICNLTLLDEFISCQNKNVYISKAQTIEDSLKEYSLKNKDMVSEDYSFSYNIDSDKNIIDFSEKENYGEYIKYHAKMNIIGKDIVKDKREIEENIKLAFQSEKQEHVSLMTYDENNKITGMEIVSKGEFENSSIEPKIIILSMLNADKNPKGIILMHNHPSEDPDPSYNDLKTTQNIANILNKFNIETAEHYIITKEEVYSINKDLRSKNSDSINFANKEYNKAIAREISESKNKLELHIEEHKSKNNILVR